MTGTILGHRDIQISNPCCHGPFLKRDIGKNKYISSSESFVKKDKARG